MSFWYLVVGILEVLDFVWTWVWNWRSIVCLVGGLVFGMIVCGSVGNETVKTVVAILGMLGGLIGGVVWEVKAGRR